MQNWAARNDLMLDLMPIRPLSVNIGKQLGIPKFHDIANIQMSPML